MKTISMDRLETIYFLKSHERQVDAMKSLREETGIGLKESRDFFLYDSFYEAVEFLYNTKFVEISMQTK